MDEAPTDALDRALAEIEALKREADRQTLLVRELNHRLKNSLAIVQSLAHQSFRDPASAADLAIYTGRLQALAGAHDILVQTDWRSASLAAVIRASIIACTSDERVTLEGPDLPVSARNAVSTALGVHELCTNAVKYGALSNERGRVSVRWWLESDPVPRFVLEWRESGGPCVEKPTRSGFGTRMLRSGLAKNLNGSIDLSFDPHGVRCRFVTVLGGTA